MAFAQAAPDSAVFAGTVVDPSGGVVAGASVTVVDGHSREHRVSTGTDGGFAIAIAAPGPFTVLAAADGFGTAVVTVETASDRLALELPVASVEELVTVTSPRVDAVVTSGTKLSTRLLDVPQTIDVVPGSLLRVQAAMSLQDALRNVAGVSPNAGEGRRDQFLIRGFTAQNDTLIDGVRDDALYYRDLATVERIEVLKGPAAALFGRGSSGGVINRISKVPRVDAPVDEYAATFGTLGVRRATADVGRTVASGRVSSRVVVAGEDSSTFRDYSALERAIVAPSFRWIAGATTVLGQFEYLHDRRVPDRGIPSVNGRPANVDRAQYYGAPGDDFVHSDVTGATVRLEHRLTSAWLIRNILRAAVHDTAFSNTGPIGVRSDAGALTVMRQQYNVDMTQTNRFNQTEVVGAAGFAGVSHTLLAGVEFGAQRRRQMRFNGLAADVNLLDPVLTRPVHGPRPATNNVFDGTTAALYVQDLMTFGTRWKALAGARRDHYRQALDDRNSGDSDVARSDDTWSPRAGLVFQPTRSTSLYTSASRSFQPSGEGLSLAVNAAELEPETSRNLEAGAKADFAGGRATATMALFRLDRRNMKTTDPLDPTRLVVVGRQRTDGVELAVDGRVGRRLAAHAGYAWLRAAILRSNSVLSGVRIEGNRPALVPGHALNMWVTFTPAAAWIVGGGAAFNGERFAANDNLVTLPAFTRVDAMIGYRLRFADLALNVRNVLDTTFFETATSNFQISPGAPREALLTLRFGRGR